MRIGAIKDFQESFYLRSSEHQGKVIWKIDSGLIHAVIVGEDFKGNLFIVCNDPLSRKYELRELDGFDNTFCYHQDIGLEDDLIASVLQAFEMLVQFNEYTDVTYAPTHRFSIPQINKPAYEVSLTTEVGHVAYDLFKLDAIKTKAGETVTALRSALGLFPRKVAGTKAAVERRIQPEYPMELGSMTA